MGQYATMWDEKAATTEIIKDWNGIDQVLLRNPLGASAKISLHGGQVISWRNEHGEELLFTSNKIINVGETTRPRGFGFVTFKDEKSMRDAIEEINGKEFDAIASPLRGSIVFVKLIFL